MLACCTGQADKACLRPMHLAGISVARTCHVWANSRQQHSGLVTLSRCKCDMEGKPKHTGGDGPACYT